MQTIKIDLDTNIQELEIHLFADLHIGDKMCDLKQIKERIEYVRRTPNAYAILNGDIMNNATKASVSDSYAEVIPPMEQLNTCIKLFDPIKDKILCITSGNHENRTSKDDGIDLMEVVANQFGIADRYSKVAAVLFVRFGWNHNRKRRQWYSFYVTHGSGGGKRAGGKVNALEDMASIVDTDIYVHSHTHLPFVMKQSFFRTDHINSCVRPVEKLFVNTSAELDYGGYGEAFGFRPASKECPVIYLSGNKKVANARL